MNFTFCGDTRLIKTLERGNSASLDASEDITGIGAVDACCAFKSFLTNDLTLVGVCWRESGLKALLSGGSLNGEGCCGGDDDHGRGLSVDIELLDGDACLDDETGKDAVKSAASVRLLTSGSVLS